MLCNEDSPWKYQQMPEASRRLLLADLVNPEVARVWPDLGPEQRNLPPAANLEELH